MNYAYASPLSPHSLQPTRGPRGTGPPSPPRQSRPPPSPRKNRGTQVGGRGRARLHACSRLPPQEPRWTSKPAPAHKDATRAAPGDSKRARTGAVWGPRPPWPEQRQRHPLCCLPREGRGTDRGKATPRPTCPPDRITGEDGAQSALPPPPPIPCVGTPETRKLTPLGAHRPKPGRGEAGPGRPPQSKPNGGRDRGRTRGGAQTRWNGPTSAQGRDRARCARHINPGRGGGCARRESTSAHTHKGHAGNTRRATGPSPRTAQTAWNGVPASAVNEKKYSRKK